MKKFLLAAFAALFVSGSAMAIDNEPEEGLTWQGQIGLNLSNIRRSNSDLKPGANVGFYGQYMFENAHGTFVNFGINYDMNGAKKSTSDPVFGKAVYEYTTHYINIPVHLGFQYNIIPELGVYADFGPYFGIGIGGKNKLDFSDDSFKDIKHNIFKVDKDNPTNFYQQRFDWGLGFRVGAEYNEHYSLNFGFNWGLMDILKEDYRKVYKDKFDQQLPNYQNFNFYITLGYRF